MTDESDGAPGRSSVMRGLAAGVVAILALYWLVSVRGAPARVVAIRQCENAYHAARTPADTAAVDSITAVGPGANNGGARTCFDLRRQGRLR